MTGLDNIRRIYRYVTICSVVLLLSPFAASAEPSSAYLKCQNMLAEREKVYLEGLDKLKLKYDTRLEKLVKSTVARGSGKGSSDDLHASIGRIKNWHNGHQAHENFVANGTEFVKRALGDDVPNFYCPSRSSVKNNFKGFLNTFDDLLETIEGEVEKRMDLEGLRDDEGLVIIAYNSEQWATEVRINRRSAIGGNIIFDPIGTGEHFRVYRAKAGTYNWDEITQKFYSMKMLYDLSKLDLGFEVKAGKLNYAGVFMFNVRAGNYYKATLEDRLTITLLVLEQRYPELMKQHEIVNGLVPDDRFTQFYLSEKGLITSWSETDDDE